PVFSMFFLLVCFFATPAITAQEMSGAELLPRLSSGTTDSVGQAEADPTRAGGESAGAEKPPETHVSGEPGSISYGIIVLAMLIGGLVLLFIEVALIPGFGITGVTGIIVIFAGLGLAFWKLDIRLAVLYSFGSMAALVGLVLWAIYIFPHTSIGKKFVLNAKISIEDGFTATRDLDRFVGMEGVATSDLRPSGIARIGDERMDVLSDGEFVPRQSKIKVLRVKNGALIVAMIEPPPADAQNG
ncbi:MAG TPA: NfeD family protein, partial [Candidatus Ozemobacteraceae bacterium]|nr:NfeD family protein [Candidatus Ozemobacteraceae bacterium]